MRAKCYCSAFPTALGTFSLCVDESGRVVASAFGDTAALACRIGDCDLVYDPRRTAAGMVQVKDWLAGKRRNFDLATAPKGTPFQIRVWKALQQIPYGQTTSYGAIAKVVGSSARAIGRANATNPICLIIPCHRVIGADGSLTGYAFGTEIKSRLLAVEAG